MNSPDTELKRWSSGKWALVMIFIFALQVILALRLSSPAKIEALPALPQKTWLLLSPPPPDSRWAEAFTIHNPTLFAQGSTLGFSGEAWLNARPAVHRLTDWTNPPFWLRAVTNSLGVAFRTYVQTNLPNVAGIAATTEPPLFKLPALDSLLATQSEFSVEGDLVDWRPLWNEPLPLIAQSEFITNSVVELLIDAKGRLLSHTLLTSSGMHLADDLALERARQVRWQRTATNGVEISPTRPRPLRGRLVFHWLTAPPTNGTNTLVPGPRS
ncbi:MAG: hypothetical protein HY043_16250 [Verrucomicrobia bacterium]|nr:hypothetical protein [Verrucomicrobiota bacterium]